MPTKNTPENLSYIRNSYGDLHLDDLTTTRVRERNYRALWEARYSSIEFVSEKLYIFTGTDSGMLIKEFSAQFEDSPIAILFVEDQQYIEVVRTECSSELQQLEQCQLITIEELNQQIENAHHDTVILAGRVNAIRACCTDEDKLGRYREIEDRIHYIIEARRWYVTNASIRLPFLHQQLLNILDMTFSAGHLKNRLREQTVVLLAAGPSLDDHIDWVKENRTDLVVICVSRISRRLIDVGIVPDFVVLLDPHAVSFEVSREALTFDPQPILAFSSQGINTIVGQWLGPKIYLGGRLPWKLEKFEIPTGSATVANLAFKLACHLMAKQIILIGLDLCLSEEGHTHAKGNLERESGISLRTDMEEVKTYDGSIRLSSIDYYSSGKQLEQQIAEQAAEIEVINPSAGAMRLEGVKFKPLSNIRLEKNHPNKILQVIRSEIAQSNTSELWMLKAKTDFWTFKRKLNKFESLAKKAVNIVEKIETRPSNVGLLYTKLDVIDKKFKKNYLQQRELCTHSCGQFFAHIYDTGANKDKYKQDEALEKSKQIYKAYLKSLKELESPLEDTQNLLRLRLLCKEPTWSQELVDHFLKLGLPTKILSSNSTLPQGAIGLAQTLQKHQTLMTGENLKRSKDDMEISEHSLFQTLNSAYVQRSLDKLMHFRNAISQMKDFAYNRIYGALAEAYLAEVLGDNDAAMTHYQYIIDEGETPLMEESLNRVAYLCIRTGDADTALMALTVLSEINPMYLATLEQFRKVA